MQDTKSAIDEALEMLALFESVGAQRFHVTFTDTQQQLRGFRPSQSPDQVRASMQSRLLANCADRGTNVIIRPISDSLRLVQLDDLSPEQLERVRPLAFLTLATSPGNHQAWVAVQDAGRDRQDAKDFVRRFKKGVGAVDRLASGSVRIAGSLNFKEKYAPNFPRVTIESAAPARTVTRAQLDSLGLVSAPEPRTLPRAAGDRTTRLRRSRRWPSYEISLAGAPISNSGGRQRSIADFVWCKTAIDWGKDVDETAAELLKVSSKAQENGEDYAQMTAENAAAALDRERGETAGRATGMRR